MNQLIKINSVAIGDDNVNSVDARELHVFLGSGKQFADWVKNKVVDSPFFQEDIDYVLLHQSVKQTGSGKILSDGII